MRGDRHILEGGVHEVLLLNFLEAFRCLEISSCTFITYITSRHVVFMESFLPVRAFHSHLHSL